jgi:hypothetical protein
MRWIGHTALIEEMKNAQNLVGKPDVKTPLGYGTKPSSRNLKGLCYHCFSTLLWNMPSGGSKRPRRD